MCLVTKITTVYLVEIVKCKYSTEEIAYVTLPVSFLYKIHGKDIEDTRIGKVECLEVQLDELLKAARTWCDQQHQQF